MTTRPKPKRPAKSIEQRLFEANRAETGLHLTARDVADLVQGDDAIATRISNQAAYEVGADGPGMDCLSGKWMKTWNQFCEMFREKSQ